MNPLLDTNCPHCKKDFTTTVPLDKLNLSSGSIHDNGNAEILQKIKDLEIKIEQKPEIKKEKPAKEKEVPSYLPKHFCKGKGCDGHDNPDAKKMTKKCRNCGQVAPENAGKCAFPGCREKDFEDLDDDELVLYNGENKEHDHE